MHDILFGTFNKMQELSLLDGQRADVDDINAW